MMTPPTIPSALAALPRLAYLAISAVIIAAMACKVGARFSFSNVNEGWNAYWAGAAWSGANLYPPAESLSLNNYPPVWFFLTGALGHLAGDNIRAGRAIAAVAVLLNAAVLSLIAREIVGPRKGAWLAGASFIALFGLFYQSYAAADDPQVLAGLLMMIAVWLAIRSIDATPSPASHAAIVGAMIAAGLVKHSVIAAPLAVALFFALTRRPRALAGFVAVSIVGVAMACAGLYLAFGKGIFASLLLPRPYDVEVAWAQTADQLVQYGLLLLVIPFLALRSDAGSRLIVIYAVVALVEGAALSGGYRVDVNAFFDLLCAVAIGLGVMAAAVAQYLRKPGPSGRLQWAAAAGWIAIALLPPLIAIPSASDDINDAFDAVTDDSYEAELQYVRSVAPGAVVCQDLALCYWAGQPLTLDMNSLRTLAWAVPGLEDRVVAQIERCRFALVELDADWTDEADGPLSDRMAEALTSRYAMVRENEFGLYWRPRCG